MVPTVLINGRDFRIIVYTDDGNVHVGENNNDDSISEFLADTCYHITVCIHLAVMRERVCVCVCVCVCVVILEDTAIRYITLQNKGIIKSV